MDGLSWIIPAGAYILGSLPTARIVTRLVTGADIRRLGDGNIGAKNTFQSVGRWPGLAVLIVDAGKGILAISVARRFLTQESFILLSGLCAVLGHDFSVFMKFQGGQGMATTAGVLCARFPHQGFAGLSVMAIVLAATRKWDISCGAGFVCFIILMGLTDRTPVQIGFTVLLAVLIGVKKRIQVRAIVRSGPVHAENAG